MIGSTAIRTLTIVSAAKGVMQLTPPRQPNMMIRLSPTKPSSFGAPSDPPSLGKMNGDEASSAKDSSCQHRSKSSLRHLMLHEFRPAAQPHSIPCHPSLPSIRRVYDPTEQAFVPRSSVNYSSLHARLPRNNVLGRQSLRQHSRSKISQVDC